MNQEVFIWLDLETTGLIPTSDYILEVAAVFSPKDAPLTKTACIDEVVKYKKTEIKKIKKACLDLVKDMHTENNLFKDLEGAKHSLSEIEFLILEEMDNYDPDTKFYLAGSSIHFDRQFIKHHMPLLDSRLHYRMLDVTGFKLAFPELYTSKSPKAHRALADIDQSMNMLRILSDTLYEKE